MQLSLFNNDSKSEIAGCVVEHFQGFYSLVQASDLFARIQAETPWAQSEIRVYGRVHPIPRLNAWYGERSYTYSGSRMDSLPMTETIEAIRQKIQAETGDEYNSVLLNLYRDGNDTVGWHSDDEPELDPNASIASLGLGAARRFVLRTKNTSKEATEKMDILLDSGDLVVMHPPTQIKTQHSVPRSKKVLLPRINLTFRRVLD